MSTQAAGCIVTSASLATLNECEKNRLVSVCLKWKNDDKVRCAVLLSAALIIKMYLIRCIWFLC